MTIEGNFTTGARADAIELVTTDHRVVEQLFVNLMATKVPEDLELRRGLTHRIVQELSVHASVEEQFLYPAIRKHVDGGDDLVDQSVEEHQRMTEALARLDDLDPEEPGFVLAAEELQRLVAQHVHEEEHTVLPLFRQSVSGELIYSLGDEMQKAKAIAPTRPHPNAPTDSKVLSAIAGIVDRVRDAARDVTERR
jgi:hemerythrin superfamily protein